MKDRHLKVVVSGSVQCSVPKAEPKRALQSLGPTSQHLQGADGRYSDNDSLRSYYK